MKKTILVLLLLLLPFQIIFGAYNADQCEIHPSMNLILTNVEEDMTKIRSALQDKQCSSFIEKRTYYFTHINPFVFNLKKIIGASGLGARDGIKNFTNFPLIAKLNPDSNFWPKTRELANLYEYRDKIFGLATDAGNKCALEDDITIDNLHIKDFISRSLTKLTQTESDLRSNYDNYTKTNFDIDKITDSYTKDLYLISPDHIKQLAEYYGRDNFLICADPEGLGGVITKYKQLAANIKNLKKNSINFGKEAFIYGPKNMTKLFSKDTFNNTWSSLRQNVIDAYKIPFNKFRELSKRFTRSLTNWIDPNRPTTTYDYLIQPNIDSEILKDNIMINTRTQSAIDTLEGHFDNINTRLDVSNYVLENNIISDQKSSEGGFKANKTVEPTDKLLNKSYYFNVEVCKTTSKYCSSTTNDIGEAIQKTKKKDSKY